MTVIGKGFEQEAIDSITLLLSNIQSSNYNRSQEGFGSA